MSKKPTADVFNLDAFRIDPNDPQFKPKSNKPQAKKGRRQFVLVPWLWLDQLKSNNHSPVPLKLALLLLYEHWRNGSPVH